MDSPGRVPLGHKMPLYMAVLYACLKKFVNGNSGTEIRAGW
jgi:hypothetical protein